MWCTARNGAGFRGLRIPDEQESSLSQEKRGKRPQGEQLPRFLAGDGGSYSKPRSANDNGRSRPATMK